jgi:hypothetical protein
MTGDLGHVLAEGGAVVGGGAALCATAFFVAGSIVHDFRPDVEPEVWARKGAIYGGVAGMVALVFRA